MRKIKIKAKNFRCFYDEHPLTVVLDGTLMALVGPNNSGKSSYLRLLYELRGLWNFLQPPSNLVTQASTTFNALDVADPVEIFSNVHTRPIQVEVEVVMLASFYHSYSDLFHQDNHNDKMTNDNDEFHLLQQLQ